jgi:predicted phage baseplate assembly protein
VIALRTRAAIFGHNAPAWKSLPATQRVGEYVPAPTEDEPLRTVFEAGLYSGRKGKWSDTAFLDEYPNGTPQSIYLDNTYPSVVKGSWVALKNATTSMVYRVASAAEESRADFALTAKVTRLGLDTNASLGVFGINDTTVFAQSDELALARLPIEAPVDGTTIELDRFTDGLFTGQHLIVCGELDGMHGVRACEHAVIAAVVHQLETEGTTRITLTRAIAGYIRETVTIYGNVARATHGESVDEVLGDGDATQPLQRFMLRQPPLTYVQSPTPDGVESTLHVRVNDILWREVPTLYGHGEREHVYATRTDEAGSTTVEFGAGAARLPTGRQNVRASYRKGTGIGGLLDAGQLSMLLTRPVGVRGVTNPIATAGAAPPESMVDARRNAPLTVLTLDRIVSLKDHEDFARAFAGVSKALATWTWDGRARTVLVTVAGAGGAAIAPDGDLSASLLQAMQRAGGPFVRRRVVSYRKALFRIAARIIVDSDYPPDRTISAVEDALRAAFGFDAREFGAPVRLSEALAVMHTVPGVVAVDVERFSRTDHPDVPLADSLPAALPRAGDGGDVLAAELLTLDPAPLELVVMP